MKKKFFYLALLFLPLVSVGQLGGTKVYSFAAIPVSPRAAALGGSAMAISDGDLSLATLNPSLLTNETEGKITLDYINYLSDISMGQVTVSHKTNQKGILAFGIQYLYGGKNIAADANGYKYGEFNSSEYIFNCSYARSFDSSFTIGATIKPVLSQIDVYNSFGLLADVGATYTTKDKLFGASLLFRNMGAQITAYDEEYGDVPFEIQLGVSKKLAHAPFRFSIVLQQLQKPKLYTKQTNYTEPGTEDNTDKNTVNSDFLENCLRHLILGVEFVPTKTFFVRAGLNYNSRQDLKLSEKPGTTGFSWGFGFRLSKFHFAYANTRYHLAGPSHQISISTNWREFLR